MFGFRPLVVFGLLLLLLHDPKRLFEELGGVFTVSALEPHSVDLDGAGALGGSMTAFIGHLPSGSDHDRSAVCRRASPATRQ